MRRRNVTIVFLALFMAWNVFTYLFLASKPATKNQDDLMERLRDLEESVSKQIKERNSLISELRSVESHLINKLAQSQKKQETQPHVNDHEVVVAPPIPNNGGHKAQDLSIDPDSIILPILVIACNRPSINVNLDQLISVRPANMEKRFPIIVSQDCGHVPTSNVIQSYGDKVTHIKHPNLTDIKLPTKENKFKGYYKISRHYKWALSQVFHHFNHNAVIIVEDDLNISLDFFEYFAASFRILVSDPTLWCVSAWNDNGKSDMISDSPDLLYRTDFFPGLGWMMTKSVWQELESKWPVTFWDDWMRHPNQRKERACIRPEISRTNTFGKVGVSKGLFYEKHLKYIKLNDKFVPFTQRNLSYLHKENFDSQFVKTVYSAPLLTVPQVLGRDRPEERVVRVQYNDKNNFKLLAKQLGIMEDLKSGVPRAAYRGVVSFMRAGRRVYFAPEPNWSGYDPTWN